MQIFIMIAQFIMGLSIIVGIHELGHMLLAKLFGMRVESYTIGYSPKIFSIQWGETVYGIGALPLGGSAKIAGMIDESLDTATMKQKPQPWEFRSKPVWQRLCVMLGGIIFNALSGIIIYILIVFSQGDSYLSKETLNKYGIVPTSIGMALGFQPGDKILAVNGKDFENFTDLLNPQIFMSNNSYYTIERQEAIVEIKLPSNFLEQITTNKEASFFINPRFPFEIGGIQPGSGAEKAGLQIGDRIIAVNNEKTLYFDQLQAVLEANAGKEVNIVYLRKGESNQTTGWVNSKGKLGFCSRSLLEYTKKTYNPIEATCIGTKKAMNVLVTNIIALGKIITGKVSASKSLSGPIGIAQIFGKQFNWLHFWNIVGFLSMVLAFTNLLPIPALDGGHVTLLAFEMITGRKIPEKIQEWIQKVGLVILLLLICYGFFNDLRKLF